MSDQRDYYQNLSPTAEAFRVLRTNLMHAFAENKWKTLVVTAAGPGEGASTVALELARSLVRNGEKVLLVDGNLRIPVLAERTEQQAAGGLSDVLRNKGAYRDVLLSKEGEPDLLGAGTLAENPSELLGSSAMQLLMDDARKHYDYIIIDTPPAAMVADAVIVSSRADATLLVVEDGAADKKEIRQTIEAIEKAGGNLLGAVMNKTVGKKPTALIK